jgi:hypothetical protein
VKPARKSLYILGFAGLVIIQGCSVSEVNVTTQQKSEPIIRLEVTNTESTDKAAAQECVTESKELIAYILRAKPDIGDDKEAQNRWLSESLRKSLAYRQDAYWSHKNSITDGPDEPPHPEQPPGNGDFVGAWDYPTSYKIEGSRRYGERIIVDITFIWGKGTQYEGDTRLNSYIFKLEDNTCKLNDIYVFEGEFIPASSLSQELREPAFH